MISLHQAHKHIGGLEPLKPVVVPLDKALGLVCAGNTYAMANCPSIDSSLKDGFAVVSADIAEASPLNPIRLSVSGVVVAGDNLAARRVTSGNAMRIMTGATVPSGATAVLASEFAQIDGEYLFAMADASTGRNILVKGSDVQQGQLVLAKETTLRPASLGLLAAAGLKNVLCHPLPRVVVAATGNELVWPGESIGPGKVAASNMVLTEAEFKALGITASTILLRDNLESLQEQFRELISEVDVLITCGGVLDGDKDFTMKAMEQIGMEKIFHRVRIGPGKGACMGRVGKTLVFNLPGGPPSHQVALLLLALPGVRRLMGYKNYLPPKKELYVTEALTGQKEWTQLIYGQAKMKNGTLFASSLRGTGRLKAMAESNVLIEIPEGIAVIDNKTLAGAWFF